jgi:hypothetical protein
LVARIAPLIALSKGNSREQSALEATKVLHTADFARNGKDLSYCRLPHDHAAAYAGASAPTAGDQGRARSASAVAAAHLVDPLAGQIGERGKLLRPAEPFRLEPAHLARRLGSWTIKTSSAVKVRIWHEGEAEGGQ